ncbi:MAG: hypothetical protein M0T84_14750 [Betaproteobacteria bacterium]|nr:hypothetical protein [Betaproteobacteria bacterium]
METMVSREEKGMEHAVVGGSASEALGGGAGAILAILGLSHVAPPYMLAIASIVLGGALLFDGALIAADYSHVLERSGSKGLSAAELGGGLSAEALTGAAAIVLGILALLGLERDILMPASAIVLGAGLVLSSGVSSRLNEVKIDTTEENLVARRVAHEAVSASSGAQTLVGISAIVLGILSLIGFAPVILPLVAMLAIGIAILLSGTAISGRMLATFGG